MRAGNGLRAAWIAVLTAVVSAAGLLAGLAVNAATGQERWPSVLDVLRRRPWEATGVLAVVIVVGGVVLWWSQDRPGPETDDPPPPPPPEVPGWVVGRDESARVVSAVCADRRTVGITTSLHGAGGFGKTTLARVVCADRRVRRHFRDRVYMVTLGRDVRGRAAIAAKVAEVTEFITGDKAAFDDPDAAGAHLGRLLDERPRTLLVLDDVWTAEQLAPFLSGGGRCVRLVTTRVPEILPEGPGNESVLVDGMSLAQAREVLTRDLPPLPEEVVRALLAATGRWALLLRLTNRLIAREIATGLAPADAAADVLRRLRRSGPAAVDGPWTPLDPDDPAQRAKAVRATLEAATGLLPPGGGERFAELGVFAEDEAVPVSLVARLWQATGGLDGHESRELCRILHGLSLIGLDPADGGRIGLHDVIGDYLRAELGPARLTELHGTLVDAVEAGLPPAEPLAPAVPSPRAAWWTLSEGYLLDHAVAHLLAAGRTDRAEALAGDIRWVEARLHRRGPSAPWSDLDRIPTPTAAAKARDLARTAHLLTPTDPGHALTTVLHNRLEPLPRWHAQVTARQDQREHPALVNHWPPPDLPHPALVRTLAANSGLVTAVAFSPDGTRLLTGSVSGVVRIWDRTTGTLVATRRRSRRSGARNPGRVVAFSPDGTWLAVADRDGTVRLRDRESGDDTAVLTGHTEPVSAVAIASDGTWLATASTQDGTVRIWDRDTGSPTVTLDMRAESVAISPDGALLAVVGRDGAVWFRDRWGGPVSVPFPAPASRKRTTALAFSPDGALLAAVGRDGTVRIWDRETGEITAVPEGPVGWTRALAFSSDGTWLAAVDGSGAVRIWNQTADMPATTFHTASAPTRALAFSPGGTCLATVGQDGAVRIWDPAADEAAPARDRSAAPVRAVAVTPDGTRIIAADRGRTMQVWDRESGRVLRTSTRTVGEGMGAVTALSPNGAWQVTVGRNGVARVRDRETSEVTATLAGTVGRMQKLVFSPDGALIAGRDKDGELRVWDRETGELIAAPVPAAGRVRVLAFSPDGALIAGAGAIGPPRVWDRESGGVVEVLRGVDFTTAMAFSPDGAWIAVCRSRGTLEVWDRVRRCFATLTRVDDRLRDCAWTPDGRGLVAGGDRGLYFYGFRAAALTAHHEPPDGRRAGDLP
ncbi:MAG TPA: NB-ARC domain-containing protein [Streptomyces sp.]|uniref:WD40 domain-containing protein n=1 Tax=Streptomyces sp. TaxID=1931 RepID=UPI002D3245E1|nr:NB-ARC domain-containing protein [Streptomyces sp.]HZG07123.1 NB-ARC domain-containing protein [Streptomyces sp.]